MILKYKILSALLLVAAIGHAKYFDNIVIGNASTVCGIAQDASGIVWTGTEKGLYSYDGYRSYPHFEPHKRENTRIHCLLIAGDTIFAGSDNGLLVYNLRTGHYISKGIKSPHNIRAILKTNDQLLLGSAQGLYSLNITTGRLTRHKGITANVYALLQMPKTILVGTINGLYIIEGSHTAKLNIVSGKQPLVNALIEDRRRNCIWVGTEGALYSTDMRRFTPVTALDGNSVKAFTIDVTGKLYIGTDNGLYTLDGKNMTERLMHDSRNANSLTNNIVWTFLTDRWHNIWVGTDNGLSLIRQHRFYDFTPIDRITGSGDGNCLHALLQDHYGLTWIGGTNGLIRFRRSSTGYEDVAWYKQDNAAHKLSHNRVRKIFEDSDGDLWVATDHGINLYERNFGRFRNFVLTDKSELFSTNWAYDIVQDSKHRLWVSAYMGGIFIIDKQRLLNSGGRCVADYHLKESKRALPSIHVGQLATDGDGMIWAMLYEKGIVRINPETFSVSRFFSDKNATYLQTDTEGNLWAGFDDAIEKFDRQRKCFVNYGNNVAVMSMCAMKGQMWVITDRDCRIFGKDMASLNFPFVDFIPFTAYFSRRDHCVYLGGNDGLMTIDPSVVSYPAKPSKLMLSGLLVNGKPFQNKGTAVSYTGNISLESDENNLTLQLTDLPFGLRAPSVYAYQLAGSDHELRYMRAGSLEIAYNGLPYGHYKLAVYTVDGAGKIATEVYSLKIEIRPPWYWSLWARLLYAVFVLGLLAWTVNFYMVKRRLREERHARESVMRQSEARMKFFSRLSHELKTSLGAILAPVYSIMADEKSGRIHDGLETIRRSSENICMLVQQSLDLDSLEDKSRASISMERIDVVNACHLITAGQSADFHTDVPQLLMNVDVVRWNSMFVLLFRFIAERTGGQGRVQMRITCDMDSSTVAFAITNDMLRISGKEHPFAFHQFLRTDNSLSLVRDFSEIHGGTINIDTPEESGTVFRLLFPFDKATALLPQMNNVSNHESMITMVQKESSDERLISEVTRAIEQNMSDSDFNVSRLQEIIGIGNKQLYRKVKQMTGRTPVEYIRDIRMRKAAVLLREGKFAVSEVMYMVGFSNSGYFSKCFQKTTGMTPTEYLIYLGSND